MALAGRPGRYRLGSRRNKSAQRSGKFQRTKPFHQGIAIWKQENALNITDARMPEQQNTFNMPKFAYENLYQGIIGDITSNSVLTSTDTANARSWAVQVPANGEIITSVNIKEKKLIKPKKKRKAQCSDRKVPKDLLSVEKDKLQEEEGVWQTKISSREKRHLRKERLKQKEDPSRASLGSLVVEQAFDWDEKRALWPLTEDTSGGGKGALIAKAECGTTLKASGAMQEESALSLAEEDVFSNVDDPSAIDLDSDWKAPLEEWGNWTGDEKHQTGDEKEKVTQCC
ncbi:protein LYRIC-like isoform X2 [Amazona aestiva]|uniref:Protein LYRIC-like isoform X2 n=1 Tax=Amazona aestiva TaxID=12930 RepID=A0A0Q3TGL1_AMAAE|nr:protein LYRIC-like isoform X2 [Amazona aestiva]